MKVKSIRISDDIDEAVELVSKMEHIENAQAIRKLMRIGFGQYVVSLYKDGQFSLRQVADLLDLSLSEAIDLMRDMGVSGNIRAKDVLDSLKSLEFPPTNPQHACDTEKKGKRAKP
jgi:hypothetical protein